MKLHNLKPPKKTKPARRVGRGLGSGKGKTASRGTKGQKARAGFNIPQRFEGGQTPLIQRLPKRSGFATKSTKLPIVHVEDINRHFSTGEKVSPQTLRAKGLINKGKSRVKLVGPGKLIHFIRLKDIILTKDILQSLPVSNGLGRRNKKGSIEEQKSQLRNRQSHA